MKTLTIPLNAPYDIVVGNRILDDLGITLKQRGFLGNVALISDDTVDALYGKRVKASLEKAGFLVTTFVFPQGESSKNFTTYQQIIRFLAQEQITRSDLMISLGGGVVGDITGFAAATYLRGIPYIQVPTTLLAALDSSVGGKTAINLPQGKNLVGSFYQPSLVYCDYHTMKTMKKNRFNDGIAEALKYGVLADKNFFEKLSHTKPWDFMEEMIITCLKIKRELITEDTYDKGKRQVLNLGHTIGHAIEKQSSYAITHGHAVAIGMVYIARIAKTYGLSQEDCETPIIKALQFHNLPTSSSISVKNLLQTIKQDKKRNGDKVTFIIPETIGDCFLCPVAINDIEEFLAPIRGTSNAD